MPSWNGGYISMMAYRYAGVIWQLGKVIVVARGYKQGQLEVFRHPVQESFTVPTPLRDHTYFSSTSIAYP